MSEHHYDNISLGGIAVAKDNPHKVGAVERLGNQVDRLNALIERLEERLVNVLSPYDPSESPDLAVPEQVRAPVHVYNDQLGYATDRLGRLLERIEL